MASICHSGEILDELISLSPNIKILESLKEGRDLLLRMTSRESGFEYLMKNGWIEKNLKEWFNTKNEEYSNEIENNLKEAMFLISKKKSNNMNVSNI
jgi:hypothetical protein